MLILQPSKDIDIVSEALERRCFNVIFKPSDDEFAIYRLESLCKRPPQPPNSQTLLKPPCRTCSPKPKCYAGFESVTAYVEKGKTSDDVIKVCMESELEVRLTPEDGPFNFLVIPKPFRDVLCDSAFEDLKSRGCNVFFETVDYMVTFGSTLWSAKRLLDASFSHSSQALA
ncbi:unnamed protein product [Eruca vesicaria subsp. sativa]|uniref:Uncharacterized protein n=1 Tax=Eruca vesicaria subsp. sativa TaxID=29727 RepID=A0ABC8KPA8_ERUVS|nr:unnamed protein product [Eruca vesicaria subsp. sativa]